MPDRPPPTFVERYGPWAFVAGGSQGIGEAFARGLAARGVNLVLVARHGAPLDSLANELRDAHGIQVKTQELDLCSADLLGEVSRLVKDIDIGLLVYNAALGRTGPFLRGTLAEHLREIDTNVRGPLILSHYFAQRLTERGRGGIILMSSMSGIQGTAMVANYAATKAYNTILAEGLWYELGPQGVDVLACVAGATNTPTYEASTDRKPTHWLARAMAPDRVAEQALDDLGRRPSRVSGARNRVAAALLGRLLSRRAAIHMVSKQTEHMYL